MAGDQETVTTRWGVPFDSERARSAALKAVENRRARKARDERDQELGATRDGQGLPILKLARDKAIQALRDTDDPRTIASLISGVTRLAPPPKDAGIQEADDELVQRYKRAGYELPYS